MSRKRDKGGGGHGGGGEERWLLPYSDMITLLLGLFIVLFAMSSIDAKQFDNVRRSLAMTFNGEVFEEPGKVLDGTDGVMDPDDPAITTDALVNVMEQAAKVSGARQSQDAKLLEKVARTSKLANDVQVNVNERGIVVSLAGDALFDSGSAVLRPQVREQLVLIERKLQSLGRTVEIAGHTDGQPFPGSGGNWRLSSERSLAVISFFLEQGFPHELLVGRYLADNQPAVEPPKGNATASMPKNRRIEITVLAPGSDSSRSRTAQILSAAGRDRIGTSVDSQVRREIDAGIVNDVVNLSKEIQ